MGMLELSSLLSTPLDVLSVRVFDEEAYRQGNYCDGSILKFRGVICDVQDRELVLLGGATPAPTDDEAIRQQLIERVPLTVTLFPHASDWSTRAYHNASVVENCENERHVTPKGTKRASELVDDQMLTISGQEDSNVIAKKSKGTEKREKVQKALLLPQAVTIYVYDGQYKDLSLDAFKVNEAFEFVGLLDLTVAGAGTTKYDGENAFRAQELDELQISECVDDMQRKERFGVVLHCSQVCSVQSIHHVRPHESIEFYKDIGASIGSQTKFCVEAWRKLGHPTDVGALRTRLVQYLAQAVYGDTLTAEYVLLVLLSHVYARADPSTPLGNLSLNLSLDKSTTKENKAKFVDGVYEVLTLLMPMVARVELSLETLNSTKLMPHKDYERDMLLSGTLQAGHGTTMLVNETVLSTGQLNEQGVKNVGALHSLIDKMLLPYDFGFYNMDFPQDVAILIVSEGKSILPAIVVLPIVAADKSCALEPPPEALLECFRLFLSVLRSLVVTIGNEEAEMAEKHYVECRKSKQKVAIQDLQRWLRLARLVALSRGEGTISKGSWDAMLALEAQRLSRFPRD